MDFTGFRCVKYNGGIHFYELLRETNLLLFDARFRRTEAEESEISKQMRLVLSIEHRFSPLEFKGLVTVNSMLDEPRTFAIICNKFFYMEPRLIPVSPSGECKQRIKSFQRWVRLRINSFNHVPQVPYLCIEGLDEKSRSFMNEVCRPKLWTIDLGHRTLLRIFMSPPSHIMFHATKCLKIPLPLIKTESHFIEVMTEWLSLMSWYKLVSTRLEPLVRRMLRNENRSMDEVSNDLQELKVVFSACKEERDILFPPSIEYAFPKVSYDLGNLFSSQLDELLNFDTLGIDNTKFDKTGKWYIEELINSSMQIARLTISYIVDLHSKDSETPADSNEDPTILLKAGIEKIIRNFHNAVHRSHKKRNKFIRRKDFGLMNVSDMIFLRTGNVLKIYIGERLRTLPPELKYELARFQHQIQRTQNLLKDMIIEVAFVLNDAAFQLYKLYIASDTLEMLVPQIVIVASSSSVVKLWKSSKFSRISSVRHKIEQISHQVEEKSSALPVTESYLSSLDDTVRDTMTKCLNLVMQREEEGAAMIIPGTFILEDFPRYKRGFSQLFGQCPHELYDIDELTGGRLYNFMISALHIYEEHRGTFEQVLQLASQCLSRITMPREKPTDTLKT